MIDVLIASAVLLVILVPAAQILITSGRVTTNATAQGIADSVAEAQVAQDRAAWTSTSSAPPYTSSSTCGSAYSSNSVNVTYQQYLTGCQTTNGMKFWIFQNGGWCVTDNNKSLVTGTTLAGAVNLYWVEVMVTWGGSAPPSPSTLVGLGNSVVLSSSLMTPNGYTGSSSGGCPL
ncbi:MAG: hypothetical protein ACYDA2_00120 [Acidimicrobiales bacterium]